MSVFDSWNGYPGIYRRRWLAQNGRCYLCGQPLELLRKRHKRDSSSREHVRPKSAGHDLKDNWLVAHKKCNELKGSRPPTACELLFLDVVNEILATAIPRGVFVSPAHIFQNRTTKPPMIYTGD